MEIGIKAMKVGEKSEFIISKDYTNDSYRNIKFKDKDKINYGIELLQCKKNQRNNSYSERPYKKKKYIKNIIKEKNTKILFGNFLNKNNIKLNDKINKNDNISKTKVKNYKIKYNQAN